MNTEKPNIFFHVFLSFFIVFSLQSAFAQVGIGTVSPDSSAVLDISSSTQGFLPPRMSTIQRNLINGGVFAEGLVIYNTDDKCIQYWNGDVWKCKEERKSNGISYSDGSAFIKSGTDSNKPQLFSMENNMAFSDEHWTIANPYVSRIFSDALWINSERVAIGSSGYKGKDCKFIKEASDISNDCNIVVRISIYDINFGLVKEFEANDLNIKYKFDASRNYHANTQKFRFALLKNGNFAIYARADGCSFPAHCSIVAVVDDEGNTINKTTPYNEIPRENISQPASLKPEYPMGVIPLDNGGFIVAVSGQEHGSNREYRKTHVFDKDGNRIRENKEIYRVDYYNSKVAWGATSYGYIVIRSDSDRYDAFDFSGKLIKSIPISLNNKDILDIPHVAGVTTARNLIRSRYKEDDFYFLSKVGVFKFSAKINQDQAEVYFEKEISANEYNISNAYRYFPVGGEINNGGFVYFGGDEDVNDTKNKIVPISIFPDGTPFIHQYDKYSHTRFKMILLNSMDQSLENLIELSIPPAYRVTGSYEYISKASKLSNSSDNTIQFSPDGKHVFTTIRAGVGWVFSIFNIENEKKIEKYSYIAKSNGVDQKLGKRFVVFTPSDQLKRMKVDITEGYQEGDQISSYCTSSSLACISISPKSLLVVSSATNSPTSEFTKTLNELYFKTTTAAGKRLIEIQAFPNDDDTNASEILKFELNVGP